VYTNPHGASPQRDYYLTVAVARAATREHAGEQEKSADKNAGQAFADTIKKLDDRINARKRLAGWSMGLPGQTLETLLKARRRSRRPAPKK